MINTDIELIRPIAVDWYTNEIVVDRGTNGIRIWRHIHNVAAHGVN